MARRIVIIAGEPSGDLHGGNLAKALRQEDKDLSVSGVGGECMRRAGVDLYFDITDMAKVGLTEILRDIGKWRRIFKTLLQMIKESEAAAAVLIDFPEFNLRLARKLKRENIPVIYYISPQVWAWRRWRVRQIGRYVAKMLVIFPFEKTFYDKSGIPVEFVGHPLLDIVSPGSDKSALKESFHVSPEKILIGLLPGSRQSEISRHLPIMIETARIIAAREPRAEFIIPRSPSLDEKLFAFPTGGRDRTSIRVVEGRSRELLAAADLAVVASGTATLEGALHLCPMAVIYRISFLTWLFLRPLIRVPAVSLVNLIAGKKVVPEFIQFHARPEKIAQSCLEIIGNEGIKERILKELRSVRGALGQPGASVQAAQAVMEVLGKV